MVDEFLKIIVRHVGRTLNVLVVRSCLTGIEGIGLRVVLVGMVELDVRNKAMPFDFGWAGVLFQPFDVGWKLRENMVPVVDESGG